MHVQFASFASSGIKSQVCDELSFEGSNTAASGGHERNAGRKNDEIMRYICQVNDALGKYNSRCVDVEQTIKDGAQLNSSWHNNCLI